jgi:hypothetical protein
MPPCPAPPGPSRAKSEGLCVTAHFVSSPASLPCVTRKAQAVGSSAAGAKDTGGSLWPRPCGDGTAGMAQGPQRSVRAAGPDRRGRTATHRAQAQATGAHAPQHGQAPAEGCASKKNGAACGAKKEAALRAAGGSLPPPLAAARQFTPLGYGQDGDGKDGSRAGG